MGEQRGVLNSLQSVVSRCGEVTQLDGTDRLLKLPTGDAASASRRNTSAIPAILSVVASMRADYCKDAHFHCNDTCEGSCEQGRSVLAYHWLLFWKFFLSRARPIPQFEGPV